MRSLTLFASLFLTLAVSAQKPGDPSPEPPPEVPPGPVTARLVAKKSTYELDRLGMTQAKYEQAIKDGKVAAPAVDLVMEFKNNTKGELELRITGAAPRLTLTLKGKGKVVTVERTVPRGKAGITYATLKPGEKYEMAITRLAGNPKGSTSEETLYWTEAGEYTLEATYRTSVRGDAEAMKKAAGKGKTVAVAAKAAKGGEFTALTTLDIQAAPIKLAVNLKK